MVILVHIYVYEFISVDTETKTENDLLSRLESLSAGELRRQGWINPGAGRRRLGSGLIQPPTATTQQEEKGNFIMTMAVLALRNSKEKPG